MTTVSVLLLLLRCLLILPSSVVLSTTTTIPLTKSRINPPSTEPWESISQLTTSTLTRARHLKHPPRTTPATAHRGHHNPANIHSNLPVYPRSYGGYSLPLSFGSPPQQIPLVMDTGSSLVWSPCTSHYICTNCSSSSTLGLPAATPLTSTIPVFHPNQSSTVHSVPCHSPKCTSVFGPSVPCKTKTCPQYAIQYGLGFTFGLLLSDKLNLPNTHGGCDGFVFGCSVMSDHQPEGIAGFGRGPASLLAQLGIRAFSYCLVSHKFDDSNKMSGSLALHAGKKNKMGNEAGVAYTPFAKNPTNSPYSAYYYVTLTNITVGGKTVNVPSRYLTPGPKGNGGTIVDSGSTFTFMDRAIHDPVAQEFARQMGRYKRAKDVEAVTGLGPCYNMNISSSTQKEMMDFPTLDLHFKGGAKMSLPLADYVSLVRVGTAAAAVSACMTVMTDDVSISPVPVEEGIGPAVILGNYQQQNFYVEFDLEKGMFGFKPKRCG